MRGLIVDFGGVLTTDVFQAFREFGENEGIDPGTVETLSGGPFGNSTG